MKLHSTLKYLASLPVAPILFSVSFVGTMFLQNITLLNVSSLFIPLIVVTLVTAVLTLLFALNYKSLGKAELFLALVVPLFFQYSTILSKIGIINRQIGPLSVDSNALLFPVFLVIYGTWFVWVWRAKKNFQNILQYLRLVALISAIFPIAQITSYVLKVRLNPPIRSSLSLPTPNTALQTSDLPDIYYLVPEDYAGAQVLKESFHYDNTPFLTALEEKGFYVASQSASNYPKTFLSIASSLNLEYLDGYSDHVTASDETALDPIISNNNVMKYLKAYGYAYYHMGSWWQSTQYNDEADENFTLYPQTKADTYNFLSILIDASLLHPFAQNVLKEFAPYSSDSQKRDAIIYQLEEMPKLARIQGPKFIFLHLIAPHGPYVFNRDCNPIGVEQTIHRYEEDNYVDQLHCINHKLLELITTIQESSKNPPVIILQSDEGAPFLNGWLTPKDSWSSASDTLLKKKFPMLSAFYFPGIEKSVLYPQISPVNTFRVLFNSYFQTNFEILPDKNYIFPDISHLYEFRDVTNRIQ